MKKFICAAALATLASVSTASASPADATFTTQTVMTQAGANALIAAGEAAAKKLNAHVCIAVTDQYGMLLAFTRMDTAPTGCIETSFLKARAGAYYRTPTDQYMDRANGKEPAIATLPGMIPLGGGSPVVLNGVVIGAVGVSGSANPNEIAIAKEAAASFK